MIVAPAALRAGPDDRPARRLLQSAARRPPADLRARAAPPAARPAVVAGHARQSAEGHRRARRDPGESRGGAAPAARPAHRGHRLRGGDRLALHLPDDRLAAAAARPASASSGSWGPTISASSISGGAGGRSPISAPIVVVDRPGSTLRALAGPAGAGARPLPPPGGDGGALRPAAAARLAVPARAALRSVVDGAAARRRRA